MEVFCVSESPERIIQRIEKVVELLLENSNNIGACATDSDMIDDRNKEHECSCSFI